MDLGDGDFVEIRTELPYEDMFLIAEVQHDKTKITECLNDINSVIAVLKLEKEDPGREVSELLEKRNAARKAGDWDKSDDLRDELKKLGIEVTDTECGTVWHRVS